MSDYLFLIPLVVALAIGWYLGRRERSSARLNRYRASLGSEYFNGLNHLIDNQTDAAIESFVKVLEHNSGTVPVRLALGTLFRRRGEVQRAIQLHQEVLVTDGLAPIEALQTKLALAQDYLAAGLLDRAESLLLELSEARSPASLQDDARGLLVTVYQREREWQKALEVSLALTNPEADTHQQCAHFCCQIAQQQLDVDCFEQADRSLQQALGLDAGCVRASLMLAAIEIERQRWKQAVRWLRRIEKQDPLFVSEAVPIAGAVLPGT